MVESPSEAFARRMAHYRQRRGWSQEQLAQELTRIGWSVHRVQVAKIETGKRDISLDEAVMIAWALGLPPALLWLPLGDADDVALAPDVVVHPDLARKWVVGKLPSTNSARRSRLVREWKSDMAVWEYHDDLADSVRRINDKKAAVRSAEYFDNPDRLENAKEDYVEALANLAEQLTDMSDRGWLVPPIHHQTAEDMRLAGVVYDGPSFDPDEERA